MFSGSRFVGFGWLILTLSRGQKHLLINTTAVTSGQGHGDVIHYIYPYMYLLYSRDLKYNSNSFEGMNKSQTTWMECRTRTRRKQNEDI